MLAVLARHGGVGAGVADVFVNVAGGVRIDEPGADLAVALAVASAATRAACSSAAAGRSPASASSGLTGELRNVAHADRRARGGRKFGLEHGDPRPTLDEALQSGRLGPPRPRAA